jgi:hypothetical protein
VTRLPTLLEELERRLRELGAPSAGAFRAGAAAGEVRARLAADGLRPHEDLVAWWGWHDGVELGPPRLELTGPSVDDRPETILLGPWHRVSLADAIRIRRWYRDAYERAGIGRVLPAAWIPVVATDGAGELYADTGAAGPAPLHVRDEGYVRPAPPAFDSLAAFVSALVEVIDEGLLVPDPIHPDAFAIDDARLAGGRRRLVAW